MAKAKKSVRRTAAVGATLGIKPSAAAALDRQVRAGFPYSKLLKYRMAVDVPWDKVAAALLIPLRTLWRRRNEGVLLADESDRLWRSARIVDLAVAACGDRPTAREWLLTPHKALKGQAPLYFAATDVGAREVERMLEAS